MRATINFEVEVGKVKTIMRSLILEETSALSDAVNCMEELAQTRSDKLIEGIAEALGHIHGAARQLEQYRDMLLSFEKSRFETMLPQPAEEMRPQINSLKDIASTVTQMKAFESFVKSIGTKEMAEDVPKTEEG